MLQQGGLGLGTQRDGRQNHEQQSAHIKSLPVASQPVGPRRSVRYDIGSPMSAKFLLCALGMETMPLQRFLTFGFWHSARKPAAMKLASLSLTAAKSSDLHNPSESLSIRPVRASVCMSAPVTKS